MEWLRRVGGSLVSDTVWRRILTEHPAIIDVCLPGNEELLRKAREDHPKLNDAIARFGLPKQSLLKELTNGGRGANVWRSSLPFIETHRLSRAELQTFIIYIM